MDNKRQLMSMLATQLKDEIKKKNVIFQIPYFNGLGEWVDLGLLLLKQDPDKDISKHYVKVNMV